MVDQFLKIGRLERDVCIHIADELVFHAFEEPHALLEGDHFRAKVAPWCPGSMQDTNAIVLPRITLDDLISSVGGVVTDNHPPLWQQRLSKHSTDDSFDEILLVVCRSHQDIGPP